MRCPTCGRKDERSPAQILNDAADEAMEIANICGSFPDASYRIPDEEAAVLGANTLAKMGEIMRRVAIMVHAADMTGGAT